MKKLLGLLLAAAIAFPASAAVIQNVEIKGEVQTIASDVKNNLEVLPDQNFYNRGAWTRAIAGLSFDVVEDVKANLLFQYAYAWGDNNYTNNGFDSAEGMRLVNANLELFNLFCCLDATIGRQFYGEDGSPIIYFGPNHYNAEGGLATALDAVTVRYSDDFKTFTVIAGKVADWQNLTRISNQEARANIFGADLKLNLTDALTAQVYGYDFSNTKIYDYDHDPVEIEAIDEDGKHMGVYGAKLGWNTDAFRASAEYARNFAGHRLVKEPSDIGYMVKADIAADINAFTARGSFVYAKQFISFGNYTPGLMYGHTIGAWMPSYVLNAAGILDGEGPGLRMFNIGFDMRPSEKWTVSLDGFSFQDRYGRHAATFEADLTAKYAYNEYVEMFGGFAYAKHGTGTIQEAFGSENYKGQLGMLVRF